MSNIMKDDQVKKWELTRAKGPLHFVLVRGVLLWGLPMFIFVAFVNKPFVDGLTSHTAVAHYVIWPTAGGLYGLLIWFLSERIYKKHISVRKNI